MKLDWIKSKQFIPKSIGIFRFWKDLGRETWLCSFMWQIYFQSNLNLFSAGSSIQGLMQCMIVWLGTLTFYSWIDPWNTLNSKKKIYIFSSVEYYLDEWLVCAPSLANVNVRHLVYGITWIFFLQTLSLSVWNSNGPIPIPCLRCCPILVFWMHTFFWSWV